MPRGVTQVRSLIASLEGDGSDAADPLRRLIAQARAADQAGQPAQAVSIQEEAVSLARQRAEAEGEGTDEERRALVTLSFLLYNLSAYYQRSDHHDDAVRALQEVVALDRRTGHPDLESDRQALERAQHLASLSPEERAALSAASKADGESSLDENGDPLAAVVAALEAQLDEAPPEEQPQIRAAIRQFQERWAGMNEEERQAELAAMAAAGRRAQIDRLADRARDGAIAALRGQVERPPLIAQIDDWAAQAAEGEEPGSPWDELAAYLRAVAALLREKSLPPVPARYADHLAAIQDAADATLAI
jgi:hypothetical protein